MLCIGIKGMMVRVNKRRGIGGCAMQEKSKERMEEFKTPEKLWNPMFLSVFFASAVLNLSQQMSNSMLSLYAKANGSPASQIGTLMSMFAVTALVFRFISGPAQNAFRRRYVTCFGLGCMTVAYLGFSFATEIGKVLGIPMVYVLMLFRLIQGIGNAFGNACMMTMASDVIPKKQFSTGMGYFMCAQVVAQAIGPTIGIWLRGQLGYEKSYLVVAVVMAVGILLCARVKEAPRKLVPFNLKLDNMIAKEALIPAGVTFLVAMGFTSINSFMLVYAEERGIPSEQASYFFTVYAVTMLATRPMIGKLTDKYGFNKVGIPCIIMTALSLVLIGISSTLPILLLAAFINAFGYGAVQPALSSLCIKAVQPEKKGSASSTNYIGLDSATIVGPTVCGWIAQALGYTPLMWIGMTIPEILGAVFVLLTRKKIKDIEDNYEKEPTV